MGQLPHIKLWREAAAHPFGHQHGLLQQQQLGLGFHIETFRGYEQLGEQAGDGNLARRAIKNRLADGPNGLLEHLTVGIGRDVAGVEVNIGHPCVIAGDEAEQHIGQKIAGGAVEPAHDAEIDYAKGSVRADEGVARVHVSMEEAVAENLQEEGFRSLAHDGFQIMASGDKIIDIVDRDTVDPGGGEDTFSRAFPIDRGDHIHRVIGEVGVQFGGCGPLHAQIHLPVEAVSEGFHSRDRLEAAQTRLGALDNPGDPAE